MKQSKLFFKNTSQKSNGTGPAEKDAASSQVVSSQRNEDFPKENVPHIIASQTEEVKTDVKVTETQQSQSSAPSKKRNLNDLQVPEPQQSDYRTEINSNSPVDSAASSKKKRLGSPSHNEASSGERVKLDTFLMKPINPVSEKRRVTKDPSTRRPVTDKLYNAFYDAPFNIGEPVPLSFIVNTFEEVALIKGENSQRLSKEALSNMFRSILLLNPAELHMAYYFSIMKIAPDYEKDNMLGVGNETMVKAISKATGCSDKQIRDQTVKLGDLGKVASINKSSQSTMDKFFTKKAKKEPLTLKRVFETFKKMAVTKGNNSTAEKENMIMKLIMDSVGEEATYIIRFIQQNLKIGAAEASMQSALCRAFLISHYRDEVAMDPDNKKPFPAIPDFDQKLEKYESYVKRAICEFPHYERVIYCMMHVGKDIEAILEHCRMTPGVPVKPMLAQPCKEIAMIFKRFEDNRFTCEYKYDGLRGQVHYMDGDVQLFSRNLENMTEQYPDVVELIKQGVGEGVRNYIFDSEIVAFDPNTERILPFQTLATRGRKNVDKNQIEVKVCLFIFDILYFNDEPLIKEPLEKRREFLKANFREVDNKLKFAEHLDTDTFEGVEGFLNQSVKMGCEGLMVKTLNKEADYEPSKRSFKWLKLKKDYLDSGLGDSFDLIPIGADYGTGKRAGVFGSFLLACWNEDMERLETICKVSTGFSDEDLEKIHKLFQEHLRSTPSPDCNLSGNEKVDVWIDPFMVWEVRGADIQISPVYTAGCGEIDAKGKGLGLRFPRLIKFREDKKIHEGTSAQQIANIYSSQAAVKNKMDFKDGDDFY